MPMAIMIQWTAIALLSSNSAELWPQCLQRIYQRLSNGSRGATVITGNHYLRSRLWVIVLYCIVMSIVVCCEVLDVLCMNLLLRLLFLERTILVNESVCINSNINNGYDLGVHCTDYSPSFNSFGISRTKLSTIACNSIVHTRRSLTTLSPKTYV